MDRMVRRLNEDYSKLIREMDSDELKRDFEQFNKNLMKNRCFARNKVLPTYIKPYFLSADQVKTFKEAVDVIINCQEKVINLYFQDEKYKHLYELKESEVPLVEISNNLKRNIYFSRLDAIMEPDSFKFLEFNCDSPGGAFFADLQVTFLQELKIMKMLGKKYEFVFDPARSQVFDTLMEAWDQFGKGGRPNFAVVGNPDVANVEEFKLFADYFADKGYSSFFTDPWTLKYDGKTLSKDGKPIDLIYRRGVLRDYSTDSEKAKAVVDAYRDGNVCIANPFSAKLGDNKNLLSVLTDDKMAFLFTEKEREMIKRHIPWTRIVREGKVNYKGDEVDLIPFLKENKNNFVVKPNSEYGGKGVVVGIDAEQDLWEETITEGLKYPKVAQEYVPIPEMEFPVFDPDLKFVSKKINVNFFTFAGKYGGGFCRTSDSSVINISAGGALVTFIVVKGKK